MFSIGDQVEALNTHLKAIYNKNLLTVLFATDGRTEPQLCGVGSLR